MHSLQQGLGLALGVIWTEVLVLRHLLLQAEVLALQLAAQSRQRVPDVVRQLLAPGGGGTSLEYLAVNTIQYACQWIHNNSELSWSEPIQQTWLRAFCR